MMGLHKLAGDAVRCALSRFPDVMNTRAGRRSIANTVNEFLMQSGTPPSVDFILVRCGGAWSVRWTAPTDPFVIHVNFHMLDGSITPIELTQEEYDELHRV